MKQDHKETKTKRHDDIFSETPLDHTEFERLFPDRSSSSSTSSSSRSSSSPRPAPLVNDDDSFPSELVGQEAEVTPVDERSSNTSESSLKQEMSLSHMQTFTTDDVNPMPSDDQFVDLNFSSEAEVIDENIRITIRDGEAFTNLVEQFSRLTVVRNLWLRVKTNNVLQVLKGLEDFIPETRTLLHLLLQIEFHEQRRDDSALVFTDRKFLGIFDHYNNLESLTIRSSTFRIEHFDKIKEAIAKNRAIRTLAHEVGGLIEKFRKDSTTLRMQQLVRLGKFYTSFWELRRNSYIEFDHFCMLMNVTQKEIDLFKKAEDYHLLRAIEVQEFDFVREHVLPHYTVEERNAVYWYHGPIPVRVIDKVKKARIFIELCNNYNFDPLTHPNYAVVREDLTAPNLKNGLFFVDLSIEELQGISEFQTLILDALAYLLHTPREMHRFSELFHRYHTLINCNTEIRMGIYKNYTIVQLVCLHFHKIKFGFQNRGEEFNFYGYLESLDLTERHNILNSRPRNYPLTVLQYLVYHHNSDLLFKMFPFDQALRAQDIVIVINDPVSRGHGLNLLNLFLLGFIFADSNSNNINRSHHLYRWIIKPEHLNLFGGDNLGDILSGPINFNEYKSHTLFQIAVLRGTMTLIKFYEHLKSDVNVRDVFNTPFPEQSALYRGWTPIQVAIYLSKRNKIDEDVVRVLVECDADLSVRYPMGSYLSGLSIFHAMVLDCREDPYIGEIGEFQSSFRLVPKKYVGDNSPRPVQVPGRNNGRNFSLDLIQFVFNQLPATEVNAICSLRRSKYYGMTVLHTALLQRNHQYASILLGVNKTNYTIRDIEGRDALDCAKHSGDERLIDLVLKTQKLFPEHINHYYESLKYDSEVCPSFQITRELWVVSFVREKGSDHAFLTIEGLERNAEDGKCYAFIRLAHLVAKAPIGKGKIKCLSKKQELRPGEKKAFSLLPDVADGITLILKPGSIFFPDSDEVSKDLCQAIWNEILAEARINENRYALWGPMRSLTSSSSSQAYDNCVSWALRKYNSLVKKSSQISYDMSMYLITHARGILNRQFHFVRQIEEGGMLERQLFAVSTHVENNFKTQVRDIARLNYLYIWCTVLTIFCVIRELGIENSYLSNRLFSILFAVVGGGVFHILNKYYFPSEERPIEEIRTPTP